VKRKGPRQAATLNHDAMQTESANGQTGLSTCLTFTNGPRAPRAWTHFR
jgi:hypothetical protein